MELKAFSFVVGAALVLSGCFEVGPDFKLPSAVISPKYKEIKGWKLATPSDGAPKGDWWLVFHDPVLSQLEEPVAISNQTVLQDAANYREALALISEARAGLFPVVNFDPSITRSSQLRTQLDAEASGSWTLDIWGKVQREVEQQTAASDESAADLANALLAARSALALAYVQLREADSMDDLLLRTIEQYKRALEIAQNQYNAGTAAKSDVITAQAQLLSAQAEEINVGVARATSEHAIAVLIGEPPAALSIKRGALAEDVPHTPVGVPSALLERRPDIAAAERLMESQNAAIGVALAGYYPSFTLSGAAGYVGDPFIRQIAGENPVWSFALSVAQPLFNGGLTDAQVEAARANYQASVASYRSTVLTALQQVEDALSTIRILGQEESVQRDAVSSAQQAVQIALNEYRAGTQNFTTVVTAEAVSLSDEENAVTTRAQRLSAAINLVVALGGGWSDQGLIASDKEACPSDARPPIAPGCF
jgi:NodT family efflux transporter outer membrane factor (OMF) lipoprotein